MLDMAMFQVIGCDVTIALATQPGQFELNVMMPVITHNLFEMMQITIGAVQVFTDRAVRGLTATRVKAEGWLAQNPIVVTTLNPLIGYSQGVELVKEAAIRKMTIHDIAVEKSKTHSVTFDD
jgi:fumarate hydratase class II